MNTDMDPEANHDAAHPQDWPYEEKVLGWSAWSIDTGYPYGTDGRQDWKGESGFNSAGFQPACSSKTTEPGGERCMVAALKVTASKTTKATRRATPEGT